MAVLAASGLATCSPGFASFVGDDDQLEDSVRGLLLGGLIGDALGGPIEFREPDGEQTGLCDAREWPDSQKINSLRLSDLAHEIPLKSYAALRPDTAAYGPWRVRAKAGTLTDDSRHKIVLLRAIAAACKSKVALDEKILAQAFLDFVPKPQSDTPNLDALVEEGLREYRYAARWILGERNPKLARPLARLWAGVNNCSGQMLLPPLAAGFAGDPDAAYRKAFELDFVDASQAKDFTGALVAGLSSVLTPDARGSSVDDRWQLVLKTMRDTDPFGYRDVPFAGRRLDKWLDKSQELAGRANKSPKKLYELLESEGKPVFWWDAHFTLLVPLTMLHFCEFNSMAAIHLTLDFGHDTDSYAQVLGCLAGAVEGSNIFPANMQEAAQSTLAEDYGESLDAWIDLLQQREWKT